MYIYVERDTCIYICVYAGMWCTYISIHMRSSPSTPRLISPQSVFAGAVNKKDRCEDRLYIQIHVYICIYICRVNPQK